MRNKVIANSSYVFSPELDAKMKDVNIDPGLTKRTIDALNAGKYDGYQAIEAKEIPGIDGESVIKLEPGCSLKVNLSNAQAMFDAKGINKLENIPVNPKTAMLEELAPNKDIIILLVLRVSIIVFLFLCNSFTPSFLAYNPLSRSIFSTIP